MDIALVLLTSPQSTSTSISAIKDAASKLVAYYPRSPEHSRLSVFFYDDRLDWKQSRLMSNKELSDRIKTMNVQRLPRFQGMAFYTNGIEDLQQSNRANAKPAVVVITDKTPSVDMLKYLNELPRNTEVVLTILEDGVKDLVKGPITLDRNIKVITDAENKEDATLNALKDLLSKGVLYNINQCVDDNQNLSYSEYLFTIFFSKRMARMARLFRISI